ncbi:MAG: hypothetical protein AAB592_04220 [Patescibacteria group bacterium]
MRAFFDKILSPLRIFSTYMSRVVTFVVLTLVYFFGIGPLAMLGWIFRKDFIGAKRHKEAKTYWLKYEQRELTLEKLKRQF